MFEIDLLHVPDDADGDFTVQLLQAGGAPFDLSVGAFELKAKTAVGAPSSLRLTSDDGEIEGSADGFLTIRTPFEKTGALSGRDHRLTITWTVDGRPRRLAEGLLKTSPGVAL